MIVISSTMASRMWPWRSGSSPFASIISAPAPMRRSPKPGPRADAGMAVVGGVGGGQEAALLVLAGEEHAVVRHEHVIEDHDARGLAVLGRELRRSLARPACGSRHDRHAGRVHRDGAAHGKVRVLLGVRAARHDEELVHVGRAGDDGLGAPDDDAVGTALLDVDVDVRVRLLSRALGAVALGVRHGDAERQVPVLHVVQVVQETLRDSRCRARRRCASSPGRCRSGRHG